MMNIEIPFLGMILLTLVVWLVMYATRLTCIFSNKIAMEEIDTPEKMSKVMPESVNVSSNNLKNLFELPIIFYALCLFIMINNISDTTYIYAAYVFLIFRSLHSLVQCTVNNVNLRFPAYFIASLALWFMLLKLIINFI